MQWAVCTEGPVLRRPLTPSCAAQAGPSGAAGRVGQSLLKPPGPASWDPPRHGLHPNVLVGVFPALGTEARPAEGLPLRQPQRGCRPWCGPASALLLLARSTSLPDEASQIQSS